MIPKGSCHCGKAAFEAEGELAQRTDCNCSICRRKGALHGFVPRPDLGQLTADANLHIYTSGQGVIRHRFCPECGIARFGEGQMPDGTAIAALNVRSREDPGFSLTPVRHFGSRVLLGRFVCAA